MKFTFLLKLNISNDLLRESPDYLEYLDGEEMMDCLDRLAFKALPDFPEIKEMLVYLAFLAKWECLDCPELKVKFLLLFLLIYQIIIKFIKVKLVCLDSLVKKVMLDILEILVYLD